MVFQGFLANKQAIQNFKNTEERESKLNRESDNSKLLLFSSLSLSVNWGLSALGQQQYFDNLLLKTTPFWHEFNISFYFIIIIIFFF